MAKKAIVLQFTENVKGLSENSETILRNCHFEVEQLHLPDKADVVNCFEELKCIDMKCLLIFVIAEGLHPGSFYLKDKNSMKAGDLQAVLLKMPNLAGIAKIFVYELHKPKLETDDDGLELKTIPALANFVEVWSTQWLQGERFVDNFVEYSGDRDGTLNVLQTVTLLTNVAHENKLKLPFFISTMTMNCNLRDNL